MTGGLLGHSSEAPKSGFAGVRKVAGVLSEVTREGSDYEKDRAKIVVEDAQILEMDEGVAEPTLKEERFTFWLPYAKPGQEPTSSSFWVRGFCKSAEAVVKAQKEALGEPVPEKVGWQALIDQVVVLEKQEVLLWKKKKDGTDPDNPEYEEFTQENFVFVLEGTETVDPDDRARSLIIGCNQVNALRAVLTDNLTKRNPKYKEAINTGAITEMLGLAVDDAGIYRDLVEAL